MCDDGAGSVTAEKWMKKPLNVRPRVKEKRDKGRERRPHHGDRLITACFPLSVEALEECKGP